MPGFHLGIDANENGALIAAPAVPIYSYTWSLDFINGNKVDGTNLIYVKDLSLPEFGVTTDEVPGASINYKYAKGITWSDVKITVYATYGLIADLEYLKAKVWTPEGGIQSAVNYKFDSTISQYAADDGGDSGKAIQIWTLHGSWVKGISNSNLTYTTSDVHNMVVTLAYDWATVTDKPNSTQ